LKLSSSTPEACSNANGTLHRAFDRLRSPRRSMSCSIRTSKAWKNLTLVAATQ